MSFSAGLCLHVDLNAGSSFHAGLGAGFEGLKPCSGASVEGLGPCLGAGLSLEPGLCL